MLKKVGILLISILYFLTGVYSQDSISSNTSTGIQSRISTTIITTIHCEINSCSNETLTTGVTTIISITNHTTTSYTTYCPLPTIINRSKNSTQTSISDSKGSGERLMAGSSLAVFILGLFII